MSSKPHTSGTPTAWSCADSLGEGLAEQWPGTSLTQKCLHNCAVAKVQSLWQSQHIPGARSHWTRIFVLIPANMATLWGLLTPLPPGKPYGLYQMHSKQENHLFQCRTWTPETMMPAPGVSPKHLSCEPSDSAPYCLYTDAIETLSFLPHNGFGKQISCPVPCKCFHSFSLFF